MQTLCHFIYTPFQHRFCVLEWSKVKMYTFYALLKDAFNDNACMFNTDKDSVSQLFFVKDLPNII